MRISFAMHATHCMHCAVDFECFLPMQTLNVSTSFSSGISAVEHKMVDRSHNLKDIDTNIRNVFSWKWLKEKDCNGHFLFVLCFSSVSYSLSSPLLLVSVLSLSLRL